MFPAIHYNKDTTSYWVVPRPSETERRFFLEMRLEETLFCSNRFPGNEVYIVGGSIFLAACNVQHNYYADLHCTYTCTRNMPPTTEGPCLWGVLMNITTLCIVYCTLCTCMC